MIALVRHHFFDAANMDLEFAFRRLLRNQSCHCHACFNNRLLNRRRVGSRAAMRGYCHDGSGFHVHRFSALYASAVRPSLSRVISASGSSGFSSPRWTSSSYACDPCAAMLPRSSASIPSAWASRFRYADVALARISADDGLHRRVGFQRCRIHPDRLAFDQSCLRQSPQHPGEDPLMGFSVDQTPGARDRHMIRRRSHPARWTKTAAA